MFRNYLKVALRIIFRNKIFSAINILGLSVGITVAILILMYIFNEISYDKFHENSDHIYRLVIDQEESGLHEKICVGTAAMGVDMQMHIPQIEKCVRFYNTDGIVSYKNKSIVINKLSYSDSTILDVFSFELLNGNPQTVLDAPFKIVLTQTIATKLFGDKNPIGESVLIDNSKLCMVTGVMQDPPENSHIQFEVLVSMSTLYEDSRYYMDWDGGWAYYTYFLIKKGTKLSDMHENLEKLFYDNINKKYQEFGVKLTPEFQALKDIYLFSDYMGEMPESGNFSYIIVFTIVAIFILVIASINFINLTTARASKRSREVGLRKVLGATKKKLRYQFLGESLLLSFISLIIAIILIETVTPAFNQLIGKQISLYNSSNILLLLGVPGLIFFIGILSGIYPAFYLASFKPVHVLKGAFNKSGKNNIRHVLVLIQFSLSVILIFSTIVIYKQIDELKRIDLGFNRENLMVITLNADEVKEKYKLLKNELKTIPEIINASAVSDWPGQGFTMNGYRPEGIENPIMFYALDVDYDYFNTMGIKIIEGRNFNESFESDKKAYIVNETLLKQLGWNDAVGKLIHRGGDHEIIGVTKDFKFLTLYNAVEPLVIKMDPYLGYSYLMVRIDSEKTYDTLKKIKSKWKELFGNVPLEYFFMNDSFNKIYESEIRFYQIISYFSILAIVIACLGLYGLSVFASEQRKQEIGIRKALGASVSQITQIMIFDFIKWVIIAIIISLPIAYLLMNRLLQSIYYRIDIGLQIYAISGITVLLVGIFTIWIQSYKAALTDPAKVLKYE